MPDSPRAQRPGSVANFGHLLLVFVILALPLGDLGWLFWAVSPTHFGLNYFSVRLLAGAVVVAALEVVDRRPTLVDAAGFTVTNALVGLFVFAVLAFLGAGDVIVGLLSRVLPLPVAYVLVFAGGFEHLTDWARDVLRETTQVPPQEPE